MNRTLLLALCLLLCPVGSANAATDLDQFLTHIRQRSIDEQQAIRQREQEFKADLDAARLKIQALRAQVAQEQTRQEKLLADYDINESRLTELDNSLRDQQGSLGEMFGAVRQSAGDFHAQFLSSLAMADRPAELDFLNQLSKSRALPAIGDLKRFWMTVLEEMVGSGRVERFASEVVQPDGTRHQADVIRVGPFGAVADGLFLAHVQGRNQFQQLPRQPHGSILNQAKALASTPAGDTVFFPLDPSRGAILSQLVQAPSLTERIMQGREVGMVILALGLIGVILFVVRYGILLAVGRGIERQLRSTTALPDNPLGRLLGLFDQHRRVDIETMEIKLEEAIIREVPRFQRGLSSIKILATVAPLLGLLGTVIGMIETFQAITLYGTGDPQLMAGGISQALVTTALGLVVAIPLLFLHNLAATKSRRLVSIMEEQGAGLLAEHVVAVRGGQLHV